MEDERNAILRGATAELAQRRADIEALRQTAEDERAALDAQRARIRVANVATDDQVRLDVGGVRYETSRATLTRVEGSMLAAMFGSCDVMLKTNPDDGSVFIDRDGDQCGMILDLLRNRMYWSVHQYQMPTIVPPNRSPVQGKAGSLIGRHILK